MNQWLTVLLEPATFMLAQIGQFLLSILGVILILIVGWLIAKAIKAGLTKGLKTVGLDKFSDSIELDSLLSKGGISYTLSELIGIIGYWLTLLLTFMIAVNAVGLTVAADLLNKIVLYIPNIIAAIFILILAMFVATILKNIVQAAANNAGVAYAKVLSKIVEVAVMVFAILIALEQLNIGVGTIHLLVTIILGSIGLGIAIAIGLGCKNIAEKMVSEAIDKLKK